LASDASGHNYLLGWTNTLQGNTDAGAWQWGGNLVTHQIIQQSNGDLTISMPSAVRAYLENRVYVLSVNSQFGNVTNTIAGTNSYRIVSNADMDVANVIFQPVALDRYKISAIVSYASSSKDFGFMIGACDGYNDFYSLRFVPSQHSFRFDKVNRSTLTSTTVSNERCADNTYPKYELQRRYCCRKFDGGRLYQ
jgi:beta-fructofuranosidase